MHYTKLMLILIFFTELLDFICWEFFVCIILKVLIKICYKQKAVYMLNNEKQEINLNIMFTIVMQTQVFCGYAHYLYQNAVIFFLYMPSSCTIWLILQYISEQLMPDFFITIQNDNFKLTFARPLHQTYHSYDIRVL